MARRAHILSKVAAVAVVFAAFVVMPARPAWAAPTLTGVVTDAASAAPLVGAQVSLFDDSGSLIAKTFTDEVGVYRFRNDVAAGGHTIKVILAAYLTQTAGPLVAGGGTPYLLDVALEPATRLEGFAYLSGVGAAPNQKVLVYGPGQTLVASRLTAGDGSYLVKNLAADTYKVKFTAPDGYQWVWWGGTTKYAEGFPLVLTPGEVSTASQTLRSPTEMGSRPIPMGGPSNRLGNDVATNCAQFQPVNAAPCGPQPLLWEAIQGPYEVHANGDPYTTLCPGSTKSILACGTPDDPVNSDYRPQGYEYAIEVAEADIGTPITFQVWDAVSVNRSFGSATTSPAPDCRSGSAPFSAGFPLGFSNQYCQAGDSSRWNDRNSIPMQFQVFDNDGSDAGIAYDSSLCELYIPRGNGPGATAADTANIATYKNRWATICTFTPTQAGVFPVRAKSSNIVRPDGTAIASIVEDSGWNAFALKLVTASSARLYNLDHVSIWSNTPGSTMRGYLGEIGEEHRGKKLVVDVFDPGDGSGSQTYTLQVLAPPGAEPHNVPEAGQPLVQPAHGTVIPAPGVVSSCRANNYGSTNRGTAGLTDNPTCSVVTRSGGTQFFQNGWLRYEIAIDPTYSCTSDCWWTFKYDFGVGSLPNDRVVFSATLVDAL